MITTHDVLRDISAVFGVTIKDIKSQDMSRRVSWCRCIYAYVCYTKFNLSMYEIGKNINKSNTHGKKCVYRVKGLIDRNDAKLLKYWTEYESKSRIWKRLNKGNESISFEITPKERKLICLETGKEYESIKQASLKLNIPYTTLYQQLIGINRNKTTLVFKQ